MDRFIDTKGSGVRGQGSEIGTEKSPSDNLSPRPSRLSPSSGFSLVELLVVITIIGMLVGLLMPALISARGRARVAQCTNNQKELGLAIIQYELAKQKLPGYTNAVNSTRVSWVPVLFPYLGRMDLWDGASKDGWRYGFVKSGNNISAPNAAVRTRLSQVVCPNGSPGAVDPDTPLSYVVNVGYAMPSDTVASAIGLFRPLYVSDNTATKPITLSSVKSPARRPMISERNYVYGSTTQAGRTWSDLPDLESTFTVPIQLGFIWPWISSPGTATMPLNSNDILPAIHQGIVIVTFCDGHVESLADNTDCYTFDNSAL